MLLDSRPLPRSLPNPAYLQRLRERAVIRMRRDELDATRVTRRWSLQRVGLALAAAGLMRSAVAAGRRTPAPQYGAPGFPGNPPAPTPTSFATRDDLVSLNAWTDSYTGVIGGSKDYSRSGKTKTIYYRMASGQLTILTLISNAGTTYVVPGGKAFYIWFDSDIVGCTFTGAELILSASLFRTPTPLEGDAAAVKKFAAQVNDKALAAASLRDTHIPIRQDSQAGKSQGYGWNSYPYCSGMNLSGDMLTISCYSPSPSVEVDLRAKKLVSLTTGLR